MYLNLTKGSFFIKISSNDNLLDGVVVSIQVVVAGVNLPESSSPDKSERGECLFGFGHG
jgi:hypothetical protein